MAQGQLNPRQTCSEHGLHRARVFQELLDTFGVLQALCGNLLGSRLPLTVLLFFPLVFGEMQEHLTGR